MPHEAGIAKNRYLTAKQYVTNMLRYNIERVVLMRGYNNARAYLKQLGYSRTIVAHLLSKPDNLRSQHIERLCLELHCSPNDLMEWLPSASTPIDEHQPLDKLRRNNLESPLHVALLGVPISKIDEAMAYLQQLGEKE